MLDQKPQQVQIDGDKVVTLKLPTHSVMFLLQILGAQTAATVAQANQANLLTEMDKQLSAQHGLTPQGSAPAGEAVRLPTNRAQRRAK